VALLDPYRALLRIEVLQLQADCLGDPRAGVETRLANQQLRIFEAREQGAVSSSSRMRSGRTIHFRPTFTRFIGFAKVSGRISTPARGRKSRS